jgi:hypothetical protein
LSRFVTLTSRQAQVHAGPAGARGEFAGQRPQHITVMLPGRLKFAYFTATKKKSSFPGSEP